MPYTVYLADRFTGPSGTLLNSHTADSGATWPNDVNHSAGGNLLELDGSGGVFLSGTSSANISTATMPTANYEVLFAIKRYSALSSGQTYWLVVSSTSPFGSFGNVYGLQFAEPGAGFVGVQFEPGGGAGGSIASLPAVGVTTFYRIRATVAGSNTTYQTSSSTDGVTYTDLNISVTTPTPSQPVFIGTYMSVGSGSAWSASTGPHLVGPFIVQDLSATTATLTGPTTGNVSVQSTAFTVTLDRPAGYGGVTVSLASTGTGDTFQGTVGGSNVTSLTIAQGASTGTFYLTPSATAGSRNVSITTSPVLTYSGSPIAYNATSTTATGYTISGASTGIVGTATGNITVTPNGTVSGTDHVTITLSGVTGTLSSTSLTFTNSSAAQSVTLTASAVGTASLTFASGNGLTMTGSPWSVTITTPPSTRTYRTVGGPFAAGLVGTVGFTVYASNGSVYSSPARITAGITELQTHGGQGTGVYYADTPITFSGAYHIVWDDGGSPARTSTDHVIPRAVETNGYNIEQALALILSTVANKSSGNTSSGGSPLFLGTDGSTQRVGGTCDQFGNRTASTLNPPT